MDTGRRVLNEDYSLQTWRSLPKDNQLLHFENTHLFLTFQAQILSSLTST